MVTNRRHRPGTYSGYNWHIEQRRELAPDGKPWGDRHEICKPCRLANARQAHSRRKRLYLNGGKGLSYPLIGIRRRLQALNAVGWTFMELGRRYGRDASNLSHIASSPKKKWVHGPTAEKIIAIYDELSMVDPPRDDYRAPRGIQSARKSGYVSPLAWDDEAIDDPYALPMGLSADQRYMWFWHAASMNERIEWVLEHGLVSIRRKRY